MYKKLNEKELNDFVERYFKEWKDDIIEVTCFEYNDFKSYLVNQHYILAIYKDRVETLDLQFI